MRPRRSYVPPLVRVGAAGAPARAVRYLVAFGVLSAACGGGESGRAHSPAVQLPAPIAVEDAAPREEVARPSAVRVYLDVAKNMQGFTAGRASDEAVTLARLIERIEYVADDLATQTDYEEFGTSVVWVESPRETYSLQRATWGAWSSLGVVLDKIAAAPRTSFAVVLTDLFLPWDSVQNTQTDIFAPLARVFDSGRAVAVIGAVAGFSGTLTDPSFGSVHYDGRRPIFLLAIGSPAHIAAFRRGLGPEIERQYALFTPSPVRRAVSIATVKDLEDGKPANGWALQVGAGARPERNLIRGLVPVPLQYTTTPQSEGLTWSLKLSQFLQDGAVLPSPDKVAERAWLFAEDKSAWLPWEIAQPFASVNVDGDELRVTMLGSQLQDIFPDRPYYYRGDLYLGGVAPDAPQLKWLRSWGLAPAIARDVLNRQPAMLPVLNLGQFADMLAATLSQHMRAQRVGSVALLFQRSR